MKKPLFDWLAMGFVVLGGAALAFFLTLGMESSCAADDLCGRYDRTFRNAHRVLMPGRLKHEWTWTRDQARIESACRADVCSHAGACGLLQIMPATWRDLTGRPPGTSIFHPKSNIINGVRYQSSRARVWMGRPRSDEELWDLALASYNAGAGHIIRAQSLCGGARTWDGIAPCLPDVTGRHAAETIGYVAKARRLRGE